MGTPLVVSCPACQTPHQVGEATKKFRCEQCGQTVKVPQSEKTGSKTG